MASANEVKVTYIAEIRDLTDKLKSVTDITASEARAQVAAVVAAQKAQTAALAKTATASSTSAKKASDAWSTAFKGLGDAGKAAGFGSITEHVAHASEAVVEFGGVAEATAGLLGGPMTVAVGAVTAAVAIGAVAWEAYSAEEARTAAIAKEVQAAHVALEPILRATKNAEIDAAVATGKMTEEAAKLEKAGIASMQAFAAATKEASDRIKELHADDGSWKRQAADLIEAAQGSKILQVTSLGLVNVLAAETTSSREAAQETTALMGTIHAAAKATKEGTEATKTAITASKAHADAVKAEAEAEKEAEAAYNDASKSMLDGWAAQRSARKELDGILTAANASQLSQAEKLSQAEDIAAAHATEIAGKAGQDDAQIAATVAAVRAGYEHQITQVHEEEAQKRAEADKTAADASAAAAAKSRDDWLGATASVIGSLESLAESSGRTYATTTAAGRKAAQKQWQTQHGVAVGTALALAAVAEAQAFASAPFPANLPAIAQATAGGIAAVTAAKRASPPSFHAGGLAPDEAQLGASRVQPGEGVAVISKQGMETANAGMRQGPTVNVVQLQVRHQTLDTTMYETLQRGGRAAQLLAASRTVPYGARSDTWRR